MPQAAAQWPLTIMEKMLSKKTTLAFFLVPGLAVFLGMFIFPVIYTAVLSTTDWEGVGSLNFVGIDNYVKLFTKDTVFWLSVKNTFVILGVALVGQLVPAFVLALLLHHFTRGVRIFRNAFFVPVLLSAAAIALLWQKIYDPNYGVLNELFTSLKLYFLDKDWLTDKETVLIAVIVPVVWQWIGYHMIIMYAGLKSIPGQYAEAAKIDGATGVQVVFKVTIPLMRDIIKICVVLAAIGSLKIFDNIYLMTGGGPYNLTSTVAIQMYKESFLKLQFGYGSSIAISLMAICILAFFLINKLMTRKEPIEF